MRSHSPSLFNALKGVDPCTTDPWGSFLVQVPLDDTAPCEHLCAAGWLYSRGLLSCYGFGWIKPTLCNGQHIGIPSFIINQPGFDGKQPVRFFLCLNYSYYEFKSIQIIFYSGQISKVIVDFIKNRILRIVNHEPTSNSLFEQKDYHINIKQHTWKIVGWSGSWTFSMELNAKSLWASREYWFVSILELLGAFPFRWSGLMLWGFLEDYLPPRAWTINTNSWVADFCCEVSFGSTNTEAHAGNTISVINARGPVSLRFPVVGKAI